MNVWTLQSLIICHHILPQCNSLSSHTEDTTSRTEVRGENVVVVLLIGEGGASSPNLPFSFKQDSQVLLLNHQGGNRLYDT